MKSYRMKRDAERRDSGAKVKAGDIVQLALTPQEEKFMIDQNILEPTQDKAPEQILSLRGKHG